MYKRILAVIGIAAVTGLSAITGTAHASTTGCTNGALSGYCATQTDNEATPLSLDVWRQGAFVGNKVIGYTDSANDKATDWFQFGYQGGSAKIFMYAPNGVPSNLCASQPSALAGIVLRTCNGSSWQQWVASEVGSTPYYTWTNAATGNILTFNGRAVQATGDAITSSSTPSPSQQFKLTS